jgi:hypothetical protein
MFGFFWFICGLAIAASAPGNTSIDSSPRFMTHNVRRGVVHPRP